MLVRDALLAYAHFALIIALAALLGAELVLYRKEIPADLAERIRGVDLGYGLAAGLIVVSGVLRVVFSLKGAAFYTHNPIFWTKMTLFAIAVLLSLPPTLHYLSWAGRAQSDGSILVAETEYARIRRFLIAEAIVILCIPLCAVLMARGI
jgi:putative membrane protein